MSRPARQKLPAIAQHRKPFPVPLNEREKEILLRARLQLGVGMAEIVRYAVFKVYLPKVLKK